MSAQGFLTDDAPGQKVVAEGKQNASQTLPQRIWDFILSLLAVAGIICIAAVVCAFAFNISLIMFKTGSMSPTMPAGALAIVREIPASDIEIGDVTTVSRGEQLPVTHRVVAIEPLGGDTFSIRMKGDANDGEDPQPYTVTEVRKVLWSIDSAGYLVAKAQNPMVMAVATVVMAVFVTIVFWPRSTRRKK